MKDKISALAVKIKQLVSPPKKDSKSEEDEDKKRKILFIILIFITLLAVGVTVWALFFREAVPTLAPDYAPQEIEQNAEPMGDDGDDKLEQPEGGGAVSLTYSRDVTIDLSDKKATLMFGNPTKSNQDMLVQIVIHDTVVVQSGRLLPGNQVTKLNLIDGVEKQLQPGGYDGKIVVYYYQQDTGEKAIVNTEIPVTITVKN